MENILRFRQIHLDFHTSPKIDEIGADFDPVEFAETLKRAHVNSVTAFARCHHGLLYYPSTRNPERIHPKLVRPNLLGEQIDACHARDIRVPIYITVQWDEFTADQHRDWLLIDDEGREYGTKPLTPGFYRNLDVFHPGYREFLFGHVEEVLTTLPVDGIFFDIVGARPSVAKHHIDEMDRRGLDPTDPGERMRFAVEVIREFEVEMTAHVRKFSRDCTIFYNSGHVGPRHRATADAFTHFELESLPSGGWGYLHFPQAMRYGRTVGPDCLGMTGKFHTSWGDFGSYKNPAALQFECFHMLALGAKCSVGDQLPPRGQLDAATYDLIGPVYAEVEKKEPWCDGATPRVEIAILSPEEFVERRKNFSTQSERDQPSVMGAIRILQELAAQFDIIDTRANFQNYKLILLPDEVPGDIALGTRLDAFVESGGTVLASHKSGIDSDGKFCSSLFGVTHIGDAPFSPDFFVPTDEIGMSLPRTGHAMYKKGTEVAPVVGAHVLARVQTPYFNRTWRHFCSHAHTPSSFEVGYPAAIEYGSAIYLAHPVFAQYHANAPKWVKTIVADAIERLLPRPLVKVTGPSAIIAALNDQPAKSREILHLLCYIPERRGQAFDVIEDVIPIHDVGVSVRPTREISSVKLVPDGGSIPFVQEKGVVTFTIDKLEGHAMIELS